MAPPRHPLDHPLLESLRHAHAPLAERHGAVLRYQPDVAPFVALPDPAEQTWRDLAALVGPGAVALVADFVGFASTPPEGWEVERCIPGVQLVDDGITARPDAEAVRLGPADVPEMLALVERTQPGPFRARTIELGRYLGIRRGGELVAMAGERFHPPGWTELSAVCTDPAHRGHGFATRLVQALVHGIRERGETAFLHAAASNTAAIALYESLGFRLRMRPVFLALRAPAAPVDRSGEEPHRG